MDDVQQNENFVIKTEKSEYEVNLHLEPLIEIKVENDEKPEFLQMISSSENENPSNFLLNTLSLIKEELVDNDSIKSEHLSNFYTENVFTKPCTSKDSRGCDPIKKKIKIYYCPICRKKFQNKKSRKYHFHRHFQKKPVLCSSCGETCLNGKQYINHYVLHQPKKNRRTKKPTRNELFTIALRHFNDKPFACDVCNKNFAQNRSLKRHQLVHEKKPDRPEPPLNCRVCFKMFSHAYKLNRHMLSHEKKPDHDRKPFMCEICSNQYASKHSLDNHLKTHTGDRPFACDSCDKRFFRKKLLKDHLLIHSGKRPFACHLCPKSFTQRSKLNTHMKMHEEDKPFKCDVCYKGFVSNCRLAKHALIHRETKRFHCTYCPKQFIEKRNLDAHILLHDGKKPFQCDVCSKAFTWKHNLNHHMKIHNEGSFKCDVCSEYFPRYHILKNHVRTHSN